MSYATTFCDSSTDGRKVFINQEKIIRIMAGVKRRVQCTEVFKKFNTLPHTIEFLLSLLSFIMDNLEKFQTNSDIHDINTRDMYDLQQPSANLTSHQKGAFR
jgi:hypothetical protein